MPIVTTRGIILKRRNFSEADRVMVIFTQRLGKISARARGVRKPLSKLAGNLEPFMEVTFRLAEGRTWYTMAEATPIQAFTGIREDLDKASMAYYIADVLDKLTKEHEHQPVVYELLWQTLVLLEKSPDKILLSAFVWKLLAENGYRPELFHCVESHEKLRPNNLLFSASLGGLLDSAHKSADTQAFPVSVETVKLMRIILQDIHFIEKVTLSDEIRKEFALCVKLFSEQVLEHEPKSLQFLEDIYAKSKII